MQPLANITPLKPAGAIEVRNVGQIFKTTTQDVVALEGAYHGWTSAVFEACTGPDNPVWHQTKPAFVHVAAQPDPYRGAFGDDAAAYVG